MSTVLGFLLLKSRIPRSETFILERLSKGYLGLGTGGLGYLGLKYYAVGHFELVTEA